MKKVSWQGLPKRVMILLGSNVNQFSNTLINPKLNVIEVIANAFGMTIFELLARVQTLSVSGEMTKSS